MDLQDGRAERADAVYHLVRAAVDAVEAKPETHHFEVSLGKALDACAVADVAKNGVGEGFLKQLAALQEPLVLQEGELVEAVGVASHEMREHGTRDEGTLPVQPSDELRHVRFGVEAEAMHPCVELDVDRKVRDALVLCRPDKGIEQAETVDLRLQLVLEERAEGTHLGVHHHDALRDALLAKRYALVGNGNGKVIDMMLLQHLCHLDRSCPVSVGLDHADHLRLRLHKGAVVLEVLRYGTKVDFENRFMYFLLQTVGYALEVETACALDEDELLLQRGKYLARYQRIRVREEAALDGQAGEAVHVGRYDRTHGQQIVHATLLEQLGQMGVEGMRFHAALQYVAQDEGPLPSFLFGTTVHKVEGDVEAGEVAVVGVVDERAVVLPVLHLQSHSHRLQGTQTFLDGVAVETHFQAGGTTQGLVVLEGVPRAQARDEAPLQVRLSDAFLYHLVARRVDDDLCILHQLQFLHALLLVGGKVLLVGRAKTGEDADGGLDDVLQGCHLVPLGDGGFEECHLSLFPKSEDRKRHAYL